MKDALKLIEKWEQKKKVKPPSTAEEFAPVFAQILSALAEIASKELPIPSVTIEQPDVKVELENPIQVNVPETKTQTPIVNIDSKDYTKAFTALKTSVDALTVAVNNRSNKWEVIRDNRGFIKTVEAVD